MPTLPPIDEPRTPTEQAWWTLLDDGRSGGRGGMNNQSTTPPPDRGGGCMPYYPPSPWTPREIWGFFADEDDHLASLDDEDDDSGIHVADSHSVGSSTAGDDLEEDEDFFDTNGTSSRPFSGGFRSFLQCGGLETIEESGIEKRFDGVANRACFIREVGSEDDSKRRVTVGSTAQPGVLSSHDNSSSEELQGEKLWEGETVFDELQDEIATLRDRSADVVTKTSKYKLMVNRQATARIATIRAREEAKTFVEKKKCKPSKSKKVAFADSNTSPSNCNKLLKNPQVIDMTNQPSTSAFRLLLGAEAPSRPESSAVPTRPPDAKNGPTQAPITKTSFFDDSAERKQSQQRCRNISPKSEGENDPMVFNLEQIDVVRAEIVRGVSSLTVDDNNVPWHGNGSPQEFGSNCVPPSILRKLKKLKGLKLTRTPSNLSNGKSIPMSTLSGSPSMTSGIRTYDPSIVSSASSRFVYETNPNVNSYVAYFRRGGKASESIRLYEHITPDVFPTVEREVVVKIEASTVSSTDIQVRKGHIWCDGSANTLNLPIVPGVSFCGVVHQMPRSKARVGVNVGDRVISLVPAGANARHLCVSSDKLVKVPDGIKDSALAACIPEVYLSAFQVLHLGQRNGTRYRKSSLAGKCILILGGATALGRALLEIAVAAGSTTVYATGKEKQFETICKAGGAPLGRDAYQWGSILSGRVDIMVAIDDSVGSSELRSEHMNLLKGIDGRLVIVTSPDQENRSIINLDDRTEATASTTGRKVIHYNVFEAWIADMNQSKRDLNHILKLLQDGHLRPKVLERIPLNRVPKAQDLMEGKKLNGFIICEPWIKGRKKSARKEQYLSVVKESSPREEQPKVPLSPFAAAAQRFSPLAIFGDSAFWKTVTENAATTAAAVPSKPVDPNATPMAKNLGRSNKNSFPEKTEASLQI